MIKCRVNVSVMVVAISIGCMINHCNYLCISVNQSIKQMLFKSLKLISVQIADHEAHEGKGRQENLSIFIRDKTKQNKKTEMLKGNAMNNYYKYPNKQSPAVLPALSGALRIESVDL